MGMQAKQLRPGDVILLTDEGPPAKVIQRVRYGDTVGLRVETEFADRPVIRIYSADQEVPVEPEVP